MTNFKNVLKVFRAMREFDSDDHALLNTLRNATEADIELLIEAVGPVKRATTKRARGAGKSRRAQRLSDTVRDSLQRREPTVGGFADDTDMVANPATAKDDRYEEQAAGVGGGD